jgi:hypothetical protein
MPVETEQMPPELAYLSLATMISDLAASKKCVIQIKKKDCGRARGGKYLF